MTSTTGLRQELQRLTEELAVAEVDAVRLQARVQGLRAERDALAASLAARESVVTRSTDEPLRLDLIRNRTDQIQALLRHAGRPMMIDEVRAQLESAGYGTTYQVVASTLNLLERTGRITKVARGRYVAA